MQTPARFKGAVLAVLGFVGCKTNDIQSSTNATCNFTPTEGAAFCPENTHPSGFTAACPDEAGDAPAGRSCLATSLNGCFVNCVPAFCGDGYTDSGEECDRGKENGTGRGCDATCRLTKGASCGANSDLRCSPDNTSVEVCQDNLWQPRTRCTADESCDPHTKQCQRLPTFCASPGAARCVGDFRRQTCSADHRWVDAPCATSAPQCSANASGAQCVAGDASSVSANFRMSRTQVAIGGLSGHAQSPTYQLQLGSVKR